MRLIDADALKTDIVENSITLEGVMAIETDCAKVLIDNAPTVEERPNGKWIGVVYSNNRIGVGMCNQCGVNRIIDNFCSNCGADMRGEKNG